MADLNFIDKRKLQELFGMGSGYVLNFSNNTFRDFFIDTIGKDIYDEKYNKDSGSKANRLRAFWELESNDVVGKLTEDLIHWAELIDGYVPDDRLLSECKNIARRLLGSASVPEIDVINANVLGAEFETIAKSVRSAITNNEPGSGLDRLHTFVVKYIRGISAKHGIPTVRDKPLHSIFGEYVKYLRANNRLKSDMTERILKSCISTLEAFNTVRNDQSLAHDNDVLNYDESLLIFNHITATIRFIQSLEEQGALIKFENEDATG